MIGDAAWVRKFIAERCAPKKATLGSNLMGAASRAAEELSKKYKWKSHTISVTMNHVFLCYSVPGAIFTVSVPVSKVLHTLTVTPHLEAGVRKHVAKELKRKKAVA